MQQFDEHNETPQKLKISVWGKIGRVILRSKKALFFLLLTSLLLGLLDILPPLLNRYALQTFFSETPDYSTVWYFILASAGLALAFGIVVYGFIKAAAFLEADVGYELRKESFEKLQKLSFDYYDKTPAGWIVSRLTSDARRLSEILSWGLMNVVWAVTSMTAAFVMMFIVKWQLALIVLAIMPVMFLVSYFLSKKILKSYREVRKTNSKITGAYNEGIMGNKTSKTLVLEDYNMAEFRRLTGDMRRKSIKAILFSSLLWPMFIFLSYLAVVFVLGVGGDMVINDMFDIATLYMFVSYTLFFFDPVLHLAEIIAQMQQAQAAAERVISLIELEPTIYDSVEVSKKYGTILNPKKENYLNIKGDVEFRNVDFSYIENEPILIDFNLNIKAGTSVALVGSTGSGKSTIVNLVCRFYEPTNGQVLVDGIDYKEISLGNLRSNLGYVLQAPHLFNLSVADNIRYGKKDATMDEVIKVSKEVGAHEFIMKMEKGYDSLVGEEGSLLSAGERQLISFARALLVDPKILVLDEATSSIDTKTEQAILEAIDKLMIGRTTFIVAHRLSTIKEVDKILVIDGGKIIEQGTHDELINLEGEYFNLYKNQFINEQIDLSTRKGWFNWSLLLVQVPVAKLKLPKS